MKFPEQTPTHNVSKLKVEVDKFSVIECGEGDLIKATGRELPRPRWYQIADSPAFASIGKVDASRSHCNGASIGSGLELSLDGATKRSVEVLNVLVAKHVSGPCASLRLRLTE